MATLIACGEGADVGGGNAGSVAKAGNGGSAGSGGTGGGSGGTTGSSTGGSSSSGGGSGGGSGAVGGSSGNGGSAGSTGGSSGSGGTGGSQQDTPPTWPDCTPWPEATSTVNLDGTEDVSGTFDGEFRRYVFTGDEGDPIFDLRNNATLKNVIIGRPGADGVHCAGNCTLSNVWWEDVGEDAATFQGSTSSTRVTVDCSGAKLADDKILQHNGGGMVTVTRFFADDFGKVYRSCGNCNEQYERHAVLDNIIAAAPGGTIVGLNANYGDTATLTNVFLKDPTRRIRVCERYTGNDNGGEPPYLGQGPDPEHCLYTSDDVHYFQ